MKIGFIGQGWVGKAYADNFERRGFKVVRYSLEEPHLQNKKLIKNCDYTFVCVPTPTTTHGFFTDIVESVIRLCGKIVIIKSTMAPGLTAIVQRRFPGKHILFSPEFLREKSARSDVDRPERNIIGVTKPEDADIAQKVMEILPRANHEHITTTQTAEMVKYFGNGFLMTKVIFANLMYDICEAQGYDYNTIAKWVSEDSRIGSSHLKPEEAGLRGAGGNCFVKDFEALKQLYERTGDSAGYYIFQSLIRYNNKLLFNSGKDLRILSSVYPAKVPKEEADKKPELRVDSYHGSLKKRKTVKVKDKELYDGGKDTPL